MTLLMVSCNFGIRASILFCYVKDPATPMWKSIRSLAEIRKSVLELSQRVCS